MPEDHPSAVLSRKLLVMRARDMTETTARRSALVLAPHPDDETFGCGATIARKRAAGADVTVCVATDGGAFGLLDQEELIRKRAANLETATGLLGLRPDQVEVLGFADGSLSEQSDEIVDRLADVVTRVQPEEIFLPSEIDRHEDHRALFESARRTIARTRSDALVFSYPIWFWGTQTWLPKGRGRLRTSLQSRCAPLAAAGRLRPPIVRTDHYLAAKRAAMDVYSFELQRTGPHFERWFLRDEELFFEVAPRDRAWRSTGRG